MQHTYLHPVLEGPVHEQDLVCARADVDVANAHDPTHHVTDHAHVLPKHRRVLSCERVRGSGMPVPLRGCGTRDIVSLFLR
eukprot:28678-Eustigmatos_ZCMA.PRE.1